MITHHNHPHHPNQDFQAIDVSYQTMTLTNPSQRPLGLLPPNPPYQTSYPVLPKRLRLTYHRSNSRSPTMAIHQIKTMVSRLPSSHSRISSSNPNLTHHSHPPQAHLLIHLCAKRALLVPNGSLPLPLVTRWALSYHFLHSPLVWKRVWYDLKAFERLRARVHLLVGRC